MNFGLGPSFTSGIQRRLLVLCPLFTPCLPVLSPSRDCSSSTYGTGLAVQTHDQGKTSRNNLLITKNKRKKVIKGQTTPTTQVKSLLSTLMHCSPITGHTGSACFQGIAHPPSCRVSPLQLVCPGWVEEEQAKLPATSPRATFPAFPARAAQWKNPARFLLLLKLFFPSS